MSIVENYAIKPYVSNAKFQKDTSDRVFKILGLFFLAVFHLMRQTVATVQR